jgi:hypothetical protein
MLKTNLPKTLFATRPRQNAVGLANGLTGLEDGLPIFPLRKMGSGGFLSLI